MDVTLFCFIFLHSTSGQKKTPQVILWLNTLVFFSRSRGGVPVLLDEEEIERRLLERKETLQAFKTQRKEVENRREQDRLDRNTAKERQLQEAEELQVQSEFF